MRLVTFTASGAQRVGAFVDDDRRIVDFAAAGAGADPAFGSMQALIEGAAAALDRARASVADAQRSGRGMVDTAEVKLLAPLPVPAQMRDFLCFEKHLIQAFARLRQVRAATTADPEKTLREMEAAGTSGRASTSRAVLPSAAPIKTSSGRLIPRPSTTSSNSPA